MALAHEPMPAPGEPGTVVKMLIEAKGGDYAAVARLLNISQSSLSSRITHKVEFRARELDQLARYFGVSPQVFFTPPMDFFRSGGGGGRTRVSSDYKSLVPGSTPALTGIDGSRKSPPAAQRAMLLTVPAS